jgi:hypothetical protein
MDNLKSRATSGTQGTEQGQDTESLIYDLFCIDGSEKEIYYYLLFWTIF